MKQQLIQSDPSIMMGKPVSVETPICRSQVERYELLKAAIRSVLCFPFLHVLPASFGVLGGRVAALPADKGYDADTTR